jgi:hypothetical protein
MKKVIKYLAIFLAILVIISLIVYIDYFSANKNSTNPKISLKEESENYIIYKSFFYRVYYCKSNRRYIFADYEEEVVCPNNYTYKDGYYTNSEGIKISKRDLQLLTNDGIYTSEMIESFKSDSQVSKAVSVAYEYGINKFKITDEYDDYNLAVLPSFTEEDDNYDWTYNEEDFYCIKGDNYNYQISKYENNKCGKYEQVKMSNEWCENYKSSTLVYVKGIENLCK